MAILAAKPHPGWHCLDVGAGGGSVAEWICSVVGPDGVVVATDLETKFLTAIEVANLEVRRHNIVKDPLESRAFDLVHCRAVLEHLPERDDVLRRLVDTLNHGGWLILVGADFSTVRAIGLSSEESEFFDSRFSTMVNVNRSMGFDPTYGRRLSTVMRAAGLSDVVMEGAVVEWNSDHPLAQLYTLTFQRLKARAFDEGVITADDHERLLRMMTEPGFIALSHTIYAARGCAA
jgi:SAM-dependent methyltransferase